MSTKDPITSPVSLPAGSFDYDVLKEGLNKAARGARDDYDANVITAVEASSTNVHQDLDSRAIPGYNFVDVERKDLGVTETVQVFDAKAAAKIEDERAGEATEAERLNNQAEQTAVAVEKAN